MARVKRAPRHRQSTARRSALVQGRDKELELWIYKIIKNRAASGLVYRANKHPPEVVEESLPYPSALNPARILRIRMRQDNNVLYSADDPTGALAAQSSRTPIFFGGVYRGYDSTIVFSSSEDLVYFDEIPDFVKFGTHNIRSTAVENPSGIPWIALNIEELPPTDYQPIIATVDNPELKHIFLVVTRDDIRDLVEDVRPDQWGFQEIPEDGLRERAPTLYENGCRVVESFNGILDRGSMQHIFVFDWGQHGKEW